MARINWTKRYPFNLADAIKLCLAYALHKKNYSVPRVAELIGSSDSAIYKWMSRGSLPAGKIQALEHVCGANYISEYLITSNQKIVIDIPRGLKPKEESLLELQSHFNESINLLAKFYKNDADTEETIAALTDTIKRLAGHRNNVEKSNDPELNLFNGAL
ncbi:MAG: hypothetical protein QM479_10875 [Pseudomonadota bacterium]